MMAAGVSYYVITADIIGSRTIESLAARAEQGLSRLNALYGYETAAPFILYRGDEIQGVPAEGAGIVRLIRRLRFHLRPFILRVGVGRGKIETGLDREFAWQMDGSAFHYSRQALDSIKSSRAPATRIAGPEGGPWQTVNAFYALLDAIQNRWSEKQWQAVDAYETRGTLEEAAQVLGISPQNVSKRCLAADWKAVAEAERHLSALLREGGLE